MEPVIVKNTLKPECGIFPLLYFNYSMSIDHINSGHIDDRLMRAWYLDIIDRPTVDIDQYDNWQISNWPKNTYYGLLSPNGIFYGAPYCGHIITARVLCRLLKIKVPSVMCPLDYLLIKKGWRHRNNFGYDTKLGYTQAQLDYLWEHDKSEFYSINKERD